MNVVIKSLTLSKPVYRELQLQSKDKGITIQELLKAIVIPEYLQNHDSYTSKKRSEAMKKGWETRRTNAEKEELRAKNEAADTGTGARPYEEYPKFPAGPTQ